MVSTIEYQIYKKSIKTRNEASQSKVSRAKSFVELLLFLGAGVGATAATEANGVDGTDGAFCMTAAISRRFASCALRMKINK